MRSYTRNQPAHVERFAQARVQLGDAGAERGLQLVLPGHENHGRRRASSVQTLQEIGPAESTNQLHIEENTTRQLTRSALQELLGRAKRLCRYLMSSEQA